MRLIQFKRVDSDSFSLLWDDAHSGTIGIRQLRDACPCAGCKGESVLFQPYVPAPDPSPHPGKYVLQSAETVGNYALKFVWGDGHGEGLYVWEHLRSLCGCQECSARREVAGDAAVVSPGSQGPPGQPTGVPNGLPTGMPEGMPTGALKGVPTGLRDGQPTGMPEGVPTGLRDGLPTGMPEGVPTGLRDGLPTGMPEGVPTGAPQGMTGMPRGARDDSRGVTNHASLDTARDAGLDARDVREATKHGADDPAGKVHTHGR